MRQLAPVHAQIDISQFEFFSRLSNIGRLISVLLPNILLIAGLILLVYIIVAGFKIMQNAGSSEDMGNAKQGITAAIIGFFLIFASYFIVQLIAYLTGANIFDSGF